MKDKNSRLRALCVGRHRFLADHVSRVFASLGIETRDAVGLPAALPASREFHPDVIICEYEILTAFPLEMWERDELLSKTPVIGVSLTRRPHEAHLLDVNGIGGFLYLPLLDRESALRIISAAAAANSRRYVPNPVAVLDTQAAATLD